MYEIGISERKAENIFAGEFSVVKQTGKIKQGAEIHKLAPLIQGTDGLVEVTKDNVADVIGLAAALPSGETVVYYATGEFFAEAIHLPQDVTLEALTPVLAARNIYLR